MVRAGASFLLSVAGSLVLLALLPLGRSIEVTETIGAGRNERTVRVDAESAVPAKANVLLIGIPGIAALPLAAVRTRHFMAVAFVASGVLTVLVVMLSLSVGVFYAPSAVALWFAAAAKDGR